MTLSSVILVHRGCAFAAHNDGSVVGYGEAAVATIISGSDLLPNRIRYQYIVVPVSVPSNAKPKSIPLRLPVAAPNTFRYARTRQNYL